VLLPASKIQVFIFDNDNDEADCRNVEQMFTLFSVTSLNFTVAMTMIREDV